MKQSERHMIRGGTWTVVAVVLSFLQWVGAEHTKKFIAAAVVLVVVHSILASVSFSQEHRQ